MWVVPDKGMKHKLGAMKATPGLVSYSADLFLHEAILKCLHGICQIV